MQVPESSDSADNSCSSESQSEAKITPAGKTATEAKTLIIEAKEEKKVDDVKEDATCSTINIRLVVNCSISWFLNCLISWFFLIKIINMKYEDSATHCNTVYNQWILFFFFVSLIRSDSSMKSESVEGKDSGKTEVCSTPQPIAPSQNGRTLTISKKHQSAKHIASLVRNPSALKSKSQSQSSQAKGVKPAASAKK